MKCVKIILLLSLIPSLVFSQEKLSKLKAPTSPASGIMGIQPSTILSPKSYQALEAAVFSNFYDNSSFVVPNDFALEFTPYWTKDHKLSLHEYLFPNFGDQFIRNSSLSVSSSQNYLLGDSAATNAIAFGYRTSFYIGNKNDREKIQNYQSQLSTNSQIVSQIGSKSSRILNDNTVTTNEQYLEQIKPVIREALQDLYKSASGKKIEKMISKIMEEAKPLPNFNKEESETFLMAFLHIVEKYLEAQPLFEQYRDYIKERQGFIVDIAYANLINFPTNNFEYSYVPRQSFWLTPSYRFKNEMSVLRVMGVLRYEWYNVDYFMKYFPDTKIYKNNFDYGLALSADLWKFSIQFEMVGRSSKTETPAGTDSEGNQLYTKDTNSDFQYLGTFTFNLSEQIVISYNLGNRFEPIQNQGNTLVSTLSLNFGFGSPKEDDVYTKE